MAITEESKLYKTLMTSKIHRATVTQADLHYVGSLTVDQRLLDLCGLVEGEKVSVVDITNGARLETYIIAGQRGSGVIGVNGAAAHLVHPGDLVIIIAYGLFDSSEVESYAPQVVFVDSDNYPVEIVSNPAHVPPGSGLLDPR